MVVDRAYSLLHRGGYHVLKSNCEHLATWCVTGKWESPQVQRGTVTLGALVILGLLLL
jgi:hypothetical protein